jgi:CHRD domain
MHRKSATIVGVLALAGTAIVAIPGLASGNARRATGNLKVAQADETPYLARLLGSNELPTAGDPDGVGAAAVSFHKTGGTDDEICWDINYSAIGTPTLAHIHRGISTVASGAVVVDFGTPGANGLSGCKAIAATLADEIIAAPAGFYVNIHTSDFAGGALRGQLANGPTPAGSLHLLPQPLRAYDSRATGQTKLAINTPRTVSLATAKDSTGAVQIAVPPGATAAVVTLTATDTSATGGFLKLYSAGAAAEPPTSVINWSTVGDSVATTTTVAVDATGQVKVVAGVSAAHFLIDVVGYYY